ncbi:MAG TPA: DUF4276 family protein [Candidatus Competibacteraceae bacterium]|nr:DUF4276 family protein [Candidatus Competibacteraceae bacterium]HRZ08210.1 DUF4276 family protein [Candidatus Competibacteraceae bacterium]HSA48331.1 DUF4276 family protein [Candidatus Competibacteraceae bacterium]
MIEIAIATEDALSEALVETLVQRSGRPVRIAERLRRQGFGYLKSRMALFNQIAHWRPVLVLTDLDQAECAPQLRRDWLRQPPVPNLLFRVAVREVEAWLLADGEAFAAFLGIDSRKVPMQPEMLPDPKQRLLSLVRQSRQRNLQRDILPAPGARTIQGLGYNEQLIRFVRDYWRIECAVAQAPSLARAWQRLPAWPTI